jgi:hypothetical protein
VLDFGKGQMVQAWIKDCQDGKVEVVLTRAGSDDPCVQQGAQAGEGCRCRRIGPPFVWGGGPVTIDVGLGTATQASSAGGARWGNFSTGIALDILQMINLEDVAREAPGATGASATAWSPGLQLLAELQLLSWLVVGIGGAYATMDTDVTFPEGVQTGDIRYYELGGNVKIGPPGDRRIRPYLTFGLFRTWNKADFTLAGESEYRLHKTRRDGFGAGLDYWATPRVGFRFEGLYSSTFEDHDADEHIRWKLGLLYRPFIVGRRSL